jgi:hypothetical protein
VIGAACGEMLIDRTGWKLIRTSVIMVKDGRIEKVGTQESLSVPAGYRQPSTHRRPNGEDSRR